MSVAKPSQPKLSMESRIWEILNSTFPDLECSLGDIKFPKPDFVWKFYTFILEQLQIDLSKSNSLQGQFNKVMHPDLFMDIQHSVRLSNVLRVVLSSLNNRLDFGLDDLLNPKPARNSMFMFTLLNFFSFADSRIHQLNAKVEIVGERKAKLVELLDTREQISRELNQRAYLKSKRLNNAEEIKAKKVEMEEMKKETKSLELLSEKKQSEIDDVKRHLLRVQNDISEMTIMHQKLEAQRVQSPQALSHNKDHLENKLKESKQQLVQAQEQSKEKRKALKLLDTAEKEQDARTSLLTDIVEAANINKALECQSAELLSKQKSEKDENEAAQSQLQGVKNELSKLSTQLTSLQLQWEKSRSSLKERIRHLTEEKGILEQKQDSEMRGTLESIEKVESEIAELKREHAVKKAQYERQYASLKETEKAFYARKLSELETSEKSI